MKMTNTSMKNGTFKPKLPEGVTVVNLDDPAAMHGAIAAAVGENGIPADLSIPASMRRSKDETKEPTPAAKREAKLPPVKAEPAKKAVTKKASKPEAKQATKDEGDVKLASLCKELGIAPVDARVKLRAAVAAKKLKHSPGESWSWPKGSPAIKDVKAILKGD